MKSKHFVYSILLTRQFLTAATTLFLIFQSMLSYGQLTGIKTIPGDYLTVQAAVTDLNTQGVGLGGVTFNVAAGHTETLAGKIVMTATGTAANPIIFQKNGVGANPVLNAYVGIEPTPSVLADGFWVFAGSDYVTIDGIDLMESAANTTPTTVMEFGFGLFKASDVNGCQFNIIRNCTITLDKLQNTSWTAPGHNGSVGIAVLNGLYTATGVVTVLSPSGSNSFNQFHSNTIQNCNAGIAFVGFAAASPFDLGDTNNDVGGISALTGNTILNFGGGAGATNPATGIFANQQWGFNVSYNTLNNNDGSGANHTTTMRGIFLNSSSTSASADCNFNNVTLTGGATTSELNLIENAFGSTAAGNTININNNTLTGSYPTATTGAFRGIYNNGATPALLNVQNNTISNLSYSNIANTGTGVVYPIHISGSSASSTINASGNSISNISRIGTTGGTTIGLFVASSISGLTVFANNNNIQNMSIDGTGTSSTMYGIRTSTGTITCNGNTVDGLTCIKTTGTSAMYGIYNIASPTNETFDGNTIRNLTHNGTGTTYGLFLNTTTGTRTVSNNLIHNVTTGGTTIAGMNMTSSSPNVFKNKIYAISSTSSGAPTVSGILQGSVGTAGTANIYNNYIGDITAPNATTSSATSPSVRGINVTTSTTNSSVNISFNTVYLNASSTGTAFGTAGLFVTGSTTATTANLTLLNNIIVNLSTPTGTGNTVAYQRSNANLANYNDNSNRNLFYRGVAGPQNLIYFDGTASEQLVAGFKALVSPKEAQSIAENPPFLSTVGSNANFLHINPAIGTQIESGGVNIVGITDDYDGNIRQGNVGYAGAGSAPDIGADEGDFTFADLSGPAINYTAIANTICLSNPSLDATIIDPSSVNTAPGTKPRLWFKKSTENNVLPATNTSVDNGWKWVEATNAVSPFNFVIDYSLLNTPIANGDVIEYFVVAEDLNGTPNVGANLATLSNPAVSVQLAANVFPVSNTNSYNVIALPASVTTSVTQNTLCFSGNTTVSISPSDLGAEYQWESSPAGANTWLAIPGETATSYTATGVNSSTDYRCIITCASVPVAPISPSTFATVTVNEPMLLTTTPGAVCASSPVSVQLEATANGGSDLNWYLDATSVTAIGTGNVFNTPLIGSTTTYYVAASVGATIESAAKPTYASTLNTSGNQWGLVFDVVNSDAVINSVDVYSVGTGGQMSIELRSNTGVLIQTVGPFTYPAGSTASPVLVTLPLNLPVPIGTGYRLVSSGMSGNLIRETSGNTYPYTSTSGNISITSGFITNPGSATYYWFYNWQVSTGCESPRVPVEATVNAIATSTDVVTECGAYTWIDGVNYTASNNTATFTYAGGAANGCDSIVTLDLTINNPSTSTDVITECGSYTWIDGVNYTSSNNTATFTYVGGAASGCDSIVTLDLTINAPTTGTDVIAECGSYTWIDGNTYTASNTTATFNIVGGAANGCDSLVTLDLTILTPTTGTDVISECGSYTWIDGNTYTTSNNTATFNIVGGAANGCDSLVTLDLTINNPTTGTDVISACGSYTWIDGITYSSSNNTATFNIVGGAATGCDSLVTLNLTINNVSDLTTTTVDNIITANNASATYQWLDCNNNFAVINGETSASFAPSANGSYAVELTQNGCVDTSACVAITTIGILENNFGSDFAVYPNPTNGNFTIDLGTSLDNVEIQILDVTGKVVQSLDYQNSEMIHLEFNEPAGVYLVRIESENHRAMVRLVKE